MELDKGCTRDLARNKLEFTITAGVCAHSYTSLWWRAIIVTITPMHEYDLEYLCCIHRIWDAYMYQNMYANIKLYLQFLSHKLYLQFLSHVKN